MLTSIEAEIETNGVVTLLEPVTIARKSRAIVTVIDDATGSYPSSLTSEERRLALHDLMKHAGSVRGANPSGGDNEDIDADLAGEYGKDL